MNRADSSRTAGSFEIAQGVIFQDIQDDVVVLNIATQQYYGLSSVGARAWNLILEHGDFETVVKQIEAQYQVDAETARTDLRSLVAELVDNGLLTAPSGV